MRVYPVIMCGGSGTRLWPASRPASPKQFIPLLGDRSTFQQAVSRVGGLAGVRQTIIIAGAGHRAAIGEQLAAMSAEAQLVLEPEARDSAPAMAAACAWILRQDPEGIAVVVAADHHVPDHAAFQAAVNRAVEAAHAGWIVTLGVRPTHPSEAYGYIKPGEAADGARAVAAFVEKPDAATAATYLEAGYLWNSGNFVVPARLLMAELDAYAPAVAAAARAAVDQGAAMPGVLTLGAAFSSAPKISIDYAVMEKTARAAVLPVDFAWTDLGAWNAVLSASPSDEHGNAALGDVVMVDTAGSLIRAADGMVVATVGLRNLAIVAEPDAVLICDLDASQGVKAVVDRLKALALPQVDRSPRPAGAAPRTLADYAAVFDHWLSTAALPLWWTLGADHQNGGFHETLDLTGRATAAPRRARGQARQSFVYATAGLMGWPGPWRAAAEHGLAYFNARYRMESGLYRTLVDGHGAALDDSAYLYDQAFALLAMAALYRAAPDRGDLAGEALGLLRRIEQAFAHPAGGFRETGDHSFQSNAHMHMLEASLAWAEAGGDPIWDETAARIVALALQRFIDADGGFLREFFDSNWAPAEGAAGDVVEPGHQFEWAWLLDRWAERTGNADARTAAKRLFAVGARGVGQGRDVAVDELDAGLLVTRDTARLWPQTERLKAALRLSASATEAEQRDYRDEALSACRGLWRYLQVPTPGLWRDRQGPDGRFIDQPAPASSFYHLICAVAEIRAFL